MTGKPRITPLSKRALLAVVVSTWAFAPACATLSEAMAPSSSCVAYPTEPNVLECGEVRVFLCTSESSCEARFIDQLRQREAPADVRLHRMPPGTGVEASRDAAAYGDGAAASKWLAQSKDGEVFASLAVVSPAAPVQGWTTAACFSLGDQSRSSAQCRTPLAAFTTGALFPVETNADAVAPPTSGTQASILPHVGNQGVYFDPDRCRAQMTSEGGQVECPNLRLRWREVANTHLANQVANDWVAAFAAQATVVRRRTLPCTLDAASASCLALDARMEAAPAGNITTFARAGPRAVVASCTWTGTDTLRPAPLCASFFAPEGLSAGP